MPEQAIIDTSVLIALERINIIDVLCRFYSRIILPEAVISEFGSPSIDCYSSEKVKSPMARLLVLDLNFGRVSGFGVEGTFQSARGGQGFDSPPLGALR